jgi:hypothetical protein
VPHSQPRGPAYGQERNEPALFSIIRATLVKQFTYGGVNAESEDCLVLERKKTTCSDKGVQHFEFRKKVGKTLNENLLHSTTTQTHHGSMEATGRCTSNSGHFGSSQASRIPANPEQSTLHPKRQESTEPYLQLPRLAFHAL